MFNTACGYSKHFKQIHQVSGSSANGPHNKMHPKGLALLAL
jgi:hypothetical protein